MQAEAAIATQGPPSIFNTMADTPTVPVSDIFLDGEERFEIFTVKAAERPHLLSYQEEEQDTCIDTTCTCSRTCSSSTTVSTSQEVKQS